MALPLTSFQTIAQSVPLTKTQVYVAPTGYNTIVLLAQTVNTDIANQIFTMYHRRGSVETPVVYDYSIPPTEVLIASGSSSGRLVLEQADSLWIEGSSVNLQFIASVLETLK